jgi:hypothetical protein
MSQKKWPATLEEAVGVVIAALPQVEAAKIAAMPEADLIHLHFGLGTWIRNNFGLWKGNDALMQELHQHQPAIHPDDAAMLIIEQTWRRLCEMTPKVH